MQHVYQRLLSVLVSVRLFAFCVLSVQAYDCLFLCLCMGASVSLVICGSCV